MKSHLVRSLVLAVSGVACAVAQPALAQTSSPLPLSYTTTATSGPTGSEATTALSVPGIYTYGDTFGAGVGSTAIGQTGSGFFDDYVFSVSGATADAVTSTINLNGTFEIDDLQVALFNVVTHQQFPIFGATADAAGWSQQFSAGPETTGTISVLAPTSLNTGTYALEIRGTAVGTAGGGYTGQLQLQPVSVPLPAALPLLLSGLGGLGAWARRRKVTVERSAIAA